MSFAQSRGLFKQETERRPTAVRGSVASSVDGSLFTVFLGELLGILNEFRTIFAVLLCQVGPQWMLWLRGGHQTNETLKHLRREGTRIDIIFIFMRPPLHNNIIYILYII